MGSVNKMFYKFENLHSAVLLKVIQRYCVMDLICRTAIAGVCENEQDV